MTTEKPGIGRGMMKYAGGVRKEMKRAQGARAKFAVGASGVAGAPMTLLAESAKDMMKPKGTFWSAFTKNKSVLGINLGIGSLLKQSQVFTSSISSILQIIGALVDVFIAPFLVPLIVPLIKKLASFIGPVRKYAEELAEKWVPKIQKFFGDIWSGDGSWWGKIGDTLTGLLSGAFKATGLYDWYMDADIFSVMGAFRESIQLVIKLLQSAGILESPVEAPIPGDSYSKQNAGINKQTGEKYANMFDNRGGQQFGQTYSSGGAGGYGYGSQVGPGMSRIFAGSAAGGVGGMAGGGMIDPMDFWMYNSQNDGGAQLITDKRDDAPPPSASLFISY